MRFPLPTVEISVPLLDTSIQILAVLPLQELISKPRETMLAMLLATLAALLWRGLVFISVSEILHSSWAESFCNLTTLASSQGNRENVRGKCKQFLENLGKQAILLFLSPGWVWLVVMWSLLLLPRTSLHECDPDHSRQDLQLARQLPHKALGTGASPQGATGAMNLLAWNRGLGGGLYSPTMNHLGRISRCTNAKSGGLWLLWKHDVDIKVVRTSPNYILAKVVYVPLAYSFTLDVLNFVVNYPNTPVLWNVDFFDLGYNGPAYTWTNKRFSSMPTFEHLDRCLVNANWIASFPNTSVHRLPMLYSDHCLILIKMDSNTVKIKNLSNLKIGRYRNRSFNRWLKFSWDRSRNRGFNLKTTYLAIDLKIWRRKKPNVSQQRTTIENQLSVLRAQSPTLQNHRSQHLLVQQHHTIMQK
ncbi:hypothetical protein U9M48_042160 [Paspalum notatum var. saurae]|uniref:Reverse transcriptase n=1 Tax=Paspalum notatum var. saurae TaxID=547442 RepID=A0AAQ3UUJ1_PASNO